MLRRQKTPRGKYEKRGLFDKAVFALHSADQSNGQIPLSLGYRDLEKYSIDSDFTYLFLTDKAEIGTFITTDCGESTELEDISIPTARFSSYSSLIEAAFELYCERMCASVYCDAEKKCIRFA